MATQQPPADPQPPPPANGTGPPSSGPPSSQLTPAPEPFEPQIAAAKTCLRKQVDATTKTLLQRAEQGTPREISVREIRKDTFTAEQIKDRPARAKGTLLHVSAGTEFPRERQCTGCAQAGLQVRGPFTLCCGSADLFRGACSNCVYADKANHCSQIALVQKRNVRNKPQAYYKTLKGAEAEAFHMRFVPIPKKTEKRPPALDAGEMTSSKRPRLDTSPDRAVGLTKKGLEALQALAKNIKGRCATMISQLEDMDNEIEDALAGNCGNWVSKGGSGAGGAGQV